LKFACALVRCPVFSESCQRNATTRPDLSSFYHVRLIKQNRARKPAGAAPRYAFGHNGSLPIL
jgi:hypothetical protein